MQFSGLTKILTPRVNQLTFTFGNILLDSISPYVISVEFTPQTYPSQFSTGTLFILSGGKIINNQNRFCDSYQTGNGFGVSGWLDTSQSIRYLSSNYLVPAVETFTGQNISALIINCSSGTLTADISLRSQIITGNTTLNNFTTSTNTTGYISISAETWAQNAAMEFYQSYENLLSGQPLTGYISSIIPNMVSYMDNDTTIASNAINLNYSFNTLYGQNISNLSLTRSGLLESGTYLLFDLNNSNNFSGLFDGIWSGNSFVYQDNGNILNLNYYSIIYNGYGAPFPKAVSYSVSLPTGVILPSQYITGFILINSGQYLNPPLFAVTGYYYSTGLQQSLSSMLFSTGCTGNLSVALSGQNSFGTGGSGYLSLQTVLFSGLYFGGQKYWNVVTNYTNLATGTGYILPPIAHVNTGQYGSSCFDVPLASGYNQAWYQPFNTFGTTDFMAGYVTGITLTQTGIVAGGLTGYYVTGVELTNIGFGYSNMAIPYMSFIRTGVDNLTSNASGVFLTKSTGYNNPLNWTIMTGLGGYTLVPDNGIFSGAISLNEYQNTFVIQLSCSGIDITTGITGYINLQLGGTQISESISYSKYYNLDPYALKKNNSSGLIIFNTSSDLNFYITQNELDDLYSGVLYTNNVFPYSIGDLDF